VIGYVRLPGQKTVVTDAPVFELADIHELAPEGINDVVIAVPPAQFALIPKLMRKLQILCVPVRLIVDMGGQVVIRENLFQLGRLQLLDLGNTPTESLDYSVLKRVFDIAFSLFTIVVTSPLLAIIAVCIKLSSPGPVLFKQDRVGLNGQIFSMYKFRTMRIGLLAESDTKWTTANDPRRTRIGAFLRRTSLDELPQFLNVLKGDMSVVGPRPERPHYVKKFLLEVAQYNTRHRLKVGITGWAQVNGWRGDTSIRKRIEHDLYYTQNWSLWLDLRIILLTAWAGMFGRNAY
jgi:Undecaprenyl-phosphate glucose phosphotransferase